MKKAILLLLALTQAVFFIAAQPDKKPAPKPTNQPDMNKMLEEAMKSEGMSKEEMEEMKKMMKEVMPALNEVNAKTADYPEFTNNRQLIPKKDPAKIAAFAKKVLTQPEIGAYANGLYAKMMAKADPAEMAMVKKVVAATPGATDIANAAMVAMLQGHPEAALALIIKAVATDPTDLNFQNNMGALLTSYGYPEQGMPVLKKLKKEMPWNSTVLNNIGQAWLSAGEVDSANRYLHAAVRVNPQHHEAKSGEGLVQESKGDHEKAGQTYEEAMHNSVNPFIEQVLKNNKGQKATANLDFEKIKRNLAIYEYFPKDWMPEVPVLHNNVKYYNEDYGMIQGYQEMIRQLGERIKDMTKTLGGELDELTESQWNEKDNEKKFVNEMMKSSMKGLSWMSKPAVVVLGVLSAYTTKWHLDYVDTLKKIGEWKYQLEVKKNKEIDAIYKQISDRYGTTCQQFKGQLDKLENDFMQLVNPRLRDLLVRKTEEYRQWLNAWCTWNWYVTGNTKNIILIQDINFTNYLAEMYTHIVTSMEVKMEHCNPPVREVKEVINPPEIPNFTCPAVVSIPAGQEWEDLVAGAKDLDKNNSLIKKTDKPVPNTSVAYGTKGMVAEPGRSSFIKTANGSISPGLVNDKADAENQGSLLSEYKQLLREYGDEAVKNLDPTNRELESVQDKAMASGRKELIRLLNLDVKGLLSPKEIEKMDWLGELLIKQHQLNLKRNSTQVNKLIEKMMEVDCSGGSEAKKQTDRHKEAIDKTRKSIEEEKTAMEQNAEKIKNLLNSVNDPKARQIMEDAIKLKEDFQAGKMDFDKYYDALGDITNNLEKIGSLETSDKILEAYKILDNSRQSAAIIQQGPQVLNSIEKHGIQSTVSSGPQAPGTFTPNKTLFQ
ncbi:MAG: hypothetical protein KA229_08890 [Chitinophagaceae bacterium]|nr:hypothetical protein [Chitinophagaceae bacterium]